MSHSLTRKIAVSAVWTYFSYVASKMAAFLTTAVLARLLTQSEFGIIGFALTAMSFFDAVRELGLGVALIRRRDHVEEAADTVFWGTLGSNLLMWLLLSLASPFIANFFHEPQIIAILPIMSFTFVLSGLGSTHDALLQREMGFSRRVFPTLGASIIKAIVSVTMALFGFGVWALVIGQLASRASFTTILWYVVKWRPRLHVNRGLFREMLSYGAKISLDSLLTALQENIDYVFIGRFLGEAALGVYTIAFRVPELIIINFAAMIASVLYPAYSTMQHDLDQLRNGLLGTLHYVSLITVPMGLGLALIAPQFVTVVFGAKWIEAAPIMAMLSLYGMVLSISWNIGDIYKAINRPDILWKTALFELGLLAPVLFVLAQRSAFAVAVGQLIVASVISFVRLLIALHLLQLPLKRTVSQFTPAVIGGAAMSVMVLIVSSFVATWNSLPALVAFVLVGGATYLGITFRFEKALYLKTFNVLRKPFLPKPVSLSEDVSNAN